MCSGDAAAKSNETLLSDKDIYVAVEQLKHEGQLFDGQCQVFHNW